VRLRIGRTEATSGKVTFYSLIIPLNLKEKNMTPASPATGPGTLTQSIYEASLPPAVLALLTGAATGAYAGFPYSYLTDPGWYDSRTGLKYGTASLAAAAALLTAAQLSGFPIDYICQMSGWSAPIVMLERENNGYAWVPPYGTPNVNVGPGLPPPAGEVSNYPATMPSGWIKVSTDAVDYPAYAAPAVATPPTVWTPNLSVMLSWTEAPAISNGVVTPGITQYYFGIVGGQNPLIGTPCNYQGSAFVCAYYPNAEAIGGQIKMWLLVGAASASPSGSVAA
jgi:hypothetical protein